MAEEQDAKRRKLDEQQEEVKEEEAPVVELYSYWRSSCSWRVRIALALKGIEYKYHDVHLVEGKQKADDYVAINPMKQVPSLIVDGVALTQSVAILEFLDERFPEPALLPKDFTLRAAVRAIVETINSGIQPIQNFSVLGRIGALGGDKVAWAKETIDAGFHALEQQLASVPGRSDEDTCCVGSAVTLADIALVPQVYNAKRFEVDMDQFPLISKVHAHLETLEAFKKAHPSVQPDAPADA